MARGQGRDAGRRPAALVALAAALAAAGCAHFLPPEQPPAYFWIVHSRDRSDSDRVMDQHRHPEKLLEFWNVRPGMRAADLGAGDGYFAELLARVVGPAGKVYAQVGRDESRRRAARFAARLKAPVMRGVVHVTREFENPLPPDAGGLDLVTSNFIYHALLRSQTDRARMNRAVFAALKPGGAYALTDYSGRPGGGDAQAALQRTDIVLLRKEVETAGFRFAGEAPFLHNAADPRDVPVEQLRGRADAFVLKFVKP